MTKILKISFCALLFTSCAEISDYEADLGKNYTYYNEGWGYNQLLYKNDRGVILETIYNVVTYENDENHIIFKSLPAVSELKELSANVMTIKNFIKKKEALPEKYASLYALYGKGDDFYLDIEDPYKERLKLKKILMNSRYCDSICVFGIRDKNTHQTYTFESRKDFEKALKKQKVGINF